MTQDFYSRVRAVGHRAGSMAEWLRRVIRNHLGVARGSSNLSAVAFSFVLRVSVLSCRSAPPVVGWMAERSKAPV